LRFGFGFGALRGAGRTDHDMASTSVNLYLTPAFSASVSKQDGQSFRQRFNTTVRHASSGSTLKLTGCDARTCCGRRAWKRDHAR